MNEPSLIEVPTPDLQVDFALALERIRGLYLRDALAQAVADIHVERLDQELARLVHPKALAVLASTGLRGELLFATPTLLTAQPKLLGYYRLLLGFSQKEFYVAKRGLSIFKRMEEKGEIPKAASAQIEPLCCGLCAAAEHLLNRLGRQRLSRDVLHELTLLTVGPQLRGSANNQRGDAAIARVFDLIREIVQPGSSESIPTRIAMRNAADRDVYIEFAPDPDIVLRERMVGEQFRKLIAIEVKGGQDYSNVHNRIGEAEKSHQKAKSDGYPECWTVVNVDRLDLAMAKRESPTTNHFFILSALELRSGDVYNDFRSRLLGTLSLRDIH